MLSPLSWLAYAFLIAQFAAAGVQNASPNDEAVPRPEPAETAEGAEEILVDWIHANDFSMIGLQPETYKYHVICGYRRGFQYLESQGVRIKYATGRSLTLERLKPHKLLFINLVSAERQPFLVSEIFAIRSYIEQGGSLFVVTDHSNCYFHAHRLMPLFTELGIRSFTTTACEQPPRTLGAGNGWITVNRFKPHPVTQDLKCLAIQTGGCVDPRFAVATTTESSWADEWNAGIYGEENGPGFFGDFSLDADEDNGPLGSVLAKQIGRGRIVIIPDQNMLSDTFINYGDNYRLWLNSMAWLLHDSRLREPGPYHRWQKPRVVFLEQYERAAFGVSDDEGHYHAMSLLNRHHWTFANDRPFAEADLIVLASNDVVLTEPQLTTLADHLRRDKNLLIINAPQASSVQSRGAVKRIIQLLAEETPRVANRRDTQVLTWPTGGEIHVLKGEARFDNVALPSPTQVPTAEEKQRGDLLLKAVRDALPD